MESQFIDWLRSRLGSHPALRLGPGDDAAVVRLGGADECIVTTDLLTDGVDFHLAGTAPGRIGRKALAVNLSDLAAMAARPLAAVISLALPKRDALRLAQELYEGLLPLAEQYGVAIAGGDTNTWDAPLAISITLLGVPDGRPPLTRSGAQPGDRILVTGSFGGSILARHFDFEPRVNEALALARNYQLHAGIDVSDGLSLDLSRLTLASSCGALVRLDKIPIAAAAHELSAHESASGASDIRTPLEHALSDGEDFELILAVPPLEAERILRDQPLAVPVTDIGEFVAPAGLWAADNDGTRRELEPRGWEHQME